VQSDHIYVFVEIVGLSHIWAKQCASTPSLQERRVFGVFGSWDAWFHVPMFLSADM